MQLARRYSQDFSESINILISHWELTLQMAKREVVDRYIGQNFGIFWVLLHPVFMIAIYIFVFGIVFKTKLGGTLDMPLNYTVYLLSGLIAWMAFQETMAKASIAITHNAALVKQVVFPIEILPIKGVLTSFFQQSIMMFFLLIYVLISNHLLPWTYVLLPILLIFEIMALIGLAYMLSAIGVYFRDLKDFVQLFSVAGIYLLPVVYLPSWVPAIFKPFLYMNPLSYFIWCFQDILYFGRFDHPIAWIVMPLESLFLFIFGYCFFRKLKHNFGNVL